MRNYDGVLVVVEGINGAGKTTVIDHVVKHYNNYGKSTIVYKFPNRFGIYGERIDDYLKGHIQIESKYDILDMFACDRAVVKKEIERHLEDGSIVICDRYVFSAIAYHIPKHIYETKKIRLYCNVIGYFDKDMPIPDIVYLIEGNHLSKRKCIMEIFHDSNNTNKKQRDMLYKVINNYCVSFSALQNFTNRLDEVVKFIINDIDSYVLE